MAEELRKAYDKAKEHCSEVECPVCRLWCQEWLDFGVAVYKLINEDELTDKERVIVRRYAPIVIGVVDENKMIITVGEE